MVSFAETLAGFAISALSPFPPAFKSSSPVLRTLPVCFYLCCCVTCLALCLQYVMISVGKTAPLHHFYQQWIRTYLMKLGEVDNSGFFS